MTQTNVVPVPSTVEDKIALLESIDQEVWELLIRARGNPALIRWLRDLLASGDGASPPTPPVSHGRGMPSVTPRGPQLYVAHIDNEHPDILSHSGEKGTEWKQLSAVGRWA